MNSDTGGARPDNKGVSVLLETQRAVYLGARAWLVEDSREMAWAEKYVVRNPCFRWVLGRFVEAGNANDNGHIFDLKELETAQASIAHSPLNLLHRPHHIVGSFAASELVYPTGQATTQSGAEAAGLAPQNPYVEALAAFWRYYFPDEHDEVDRAHKDGLLAYSMECVPETVTCKGAGGSCERTFAYEGRQSTTYCDHLQQPGARKLLGRPHFTGGALIVPPSRPGWKKADVTELSELLRQRAQEAEMAYDETSKVFPDLGDRHWESMMSQLLRFAYEDREGEWARDFSGDQRKQLAKKGHALPDGSYPIATPGDLANAIKAFGRSKPGDRGKVKAHIVKRAKALGKTDMLPDAWSST